MPTNIKKNKLVHFVSVNYRLHISIRRVKIKTILIILAGLLIGCSDFNTEPVITSLTADNTSVSPGGTVLLTCTAEDDNDDSLTYKWE